MGQRAVILFGHGSRDPQWRAPMDAVARRIAAAQPGVPVRCSFLELDMPDLPQAAREVVAEGATDIAILPMFLGTGRHARQDLPALLTGLERDHPGVHFRVLPSVGEDDRVLDLLARIALGWTAA